MSIEVMVLNRPRLEVVMNETSLVIGASGQTVTAHPQDLIKLAQSNLLCIPTSRRSIEVCQSDSYIVRQWRIDRGVPID